MRWVAIMSLLVCIPVQAANTPCSGKKGGIARCMGQYFVCNDGSTSQSKKDCRAYTGMPAGSDGPEAVPKPKKAKP